MRIAIHALGARRGAGAGFNRVLTMATEFPLLRDDDDFLFIVRPELRGEVHALAQRADTLGPPSRLPASLRVSWEQFVAPFALARWKPDVVFGAFNLLPLWFPGRRPRYALMITNLMPFSEERLACSGRARLRIEALRLLTWLSIRRADRVLLLSSHAYDLIGDSTLRGKATILPPAVPKFRPNPQSAEADGGPVYVVAADLDRHKSIETVIRALSLGGLEGARVKIFGRVADPGYERALRSEITRLGLGEAVSLEGRVAREALLSEMAAADACIAPARFENLSHVLAEAFASGTPLLAADIPGSREVCGDAALFFPPGDERELSNLMRRVVTEPGLREELVRRGSERYDVLAGQDQSEAILNAVSLPGAHDTRNLEAPPGRAEARARRLAARLPLVPGLQSAVKLLARRGLLPRRVWTHVPPIGIHRLEPLPGVSFLYDASVVDQLARSVVWTNMRDFEYETVHAFARLAPLSRGFLDVGAYSGIYSILVSAANPLIDVIAVEPNPTLFPMLANNLSLNHVRGAARQAAAGRERGTAHLVVPEDATTAHLTPSDGRSSHSIVEVRTLDELAESMDVVDLMKIDVEGFELEVLGGASGLLRLHHPRIIVEVLNTARASEILALLRPYGYRTFVSLLPTGPVVLEDPEAHDPRYPNLLCSTETSKDLLQLLSQPFVADPPSRTQI